MPRVCVVGSVNVDLTFAAPRLPRPGETVPGRSFAQGLGGKGANQAVAAARLGAEVALLGAVGADALGAQAVETLRRQGVDVRHVRVAAGAGTGVAGIVVDDHAENCIVVVPGANAALTPDDVRGAEAALARADIVVAQLEVPPAAVAEAFRIARAHGVRTVFNPAPAVPLPDGLLALADVCVPNETELEALTGLPAGGAAQAEEGARRLQALGPGVVVVTRGAAGALLLLGGRAEHFPAFAVRAVDPTGAGDAFTASLAVGLAQGRALPDAVRRACAVGALAVTRPGAQGALPTGAEVEAFLAGLR